MRPLLQWLLIALIRLYRRFLSPVLTTVFGPLGGCRFDPTCSVYALQAIQGHGPFRGSWLALKRIGRCHPWGGCGHDPVPTAHAPECSDPTHRCGPPRITLAATPH
ncbi:MAG: membrane protein insertion efficiency factor YidD [Verrucomicrobia bacterium]|jgi:hypothetical protein|nr:membrane protein insertion efficiency factor YidD [Verrucomicrobiota bacterium]